MTARSRNWNAEQALVEMDESDEISQGAIDGLDSALATLGAPSHESDY